ncbi:MAG: TetR/AcrR family transcriptional regulator, partial [Syntrophothermus sp.]
MSETISKEREKQILQAARIIFGRFGFSKTTMEDISEEAEMGKASLYYYFPTKESLLEAVIKQEREEFMEKAEQILAQHKSQADKLKIYVEKRIKLFEGLMNLGMLSYYSFIQKKSVYQKQSDEFGGWEMKVVQKIIEDGKASGEFLADTDSETTARLLIHILQGLRLRTVKK